MDTQAKAILDAMGKSTLKTIALEEAETPELLAIKPTRNRAEYCWTLTSLTPKLVFDRDATVNRVTYLDADIYFLKSVQPIFDEFEASGKSVLITEHAYDLEYDQAETSGKYCVQFMTFVREASEPVRKWWHERCVEWCFDRQEDGKFGDQKYLDDWTVRFGQHVHVLTKIDAILAPWNARRFPFDRALVWHFHGLRLLKNGKVLLHRLYVVPDAVDEKIYLPYLHELKDALAALPLPVVQKTGTFEVLEPLAYIVRGTIKLIRNFMRFNTVKSLPK